MTISLPDVTDEKIDVSSTNLTFTGTSGGKVYQVELEFLKEIELEGSVWNVLPQSIQMHLMKKDQEEEEFWPRLLKDKLKEKNGVTIDWNKYVDEDEEEEGFDTSALDGGQGMGGKMFDCAVCLDRPDFNPPHIFLKEWVAVCLAWVACPVWVVCLAWVEAPVVWTWPRCRRCSQAWAAEAQAVRTFMLLPICNDSYNLSLQ